MATDLKKYLDQAGVTTLWTRIAEEVAKVDTKATANAADIVTMKGQIAALEAGTYDDSVVRGLISDNADAIADTVAAIADNVAAIALLNGEADVAGSVKHTATEIAATKVAEIVANADADFDTLKEIADWILNDTTGADDMAIDIASLQQLVGNEAGATQIANAIATADLDKYALAADLTDIANRVKAIEDAKYQNAEQVSSAIDAKITALDLANTYDVKGAASSAEIAAKAYADSLSGNYDPAGSAAAAETAAKSHAESKANAAEANAKTYVDNALTWGSFEQVV